MKKLLTLSAIALGCSSVCAVAHADSTATVHIGGRVYAQTCTLKTAKNQIVQLPSVNVADLKKGETQSTDFKVGFAECDTKSSQSVYLSFNATDKATDGGLLKNTNDSPSKATNVHFKIEHKGQSVDLKNNPNTPLVAQRTLKNGEVEFNFKASYAVEGGDPTSGVLSASIPVTINYQ